jgi:hypothetical protein
MLSAEEELEENEGERGIFCTSDGGITIQSRRKCA